MFKEVKKQLLDPQQQDRAGAATIILVQDIVAQLKDIHGSTLSASTMAWTMWANYILGKDASEREGLMQSPPPVDYVNLFVRAPLHPDTILHGLRRGASIAHTVNEGVARELRAIQETVESYERSKTQTDALFAVMKQRLAALVIRVSANEDTLTAVNDAARAEEVNFSREVFERITNQVDVDH